MPIVPASAPNSRARKAVKLSGRGGGVDGASAGLTPGPDIVSRVYAPTCIRIISIPAQNETVGGWVRACVRMVCTHSKPSTTEAAVTGREFRLTRGDLDET